MQWEKKKWVSLSRMRTFLMNLSPDFGQSFLRFLKKKFDLGRMVSGWAQSRIGD